MSKKPHGGRRDGAGRPPKSDKLEYHAVRIAVTGTNELERINRLSPRERAEAILERTSPMLRRYEIHLGDTLITEFVADPALTNLYELVAQHYTDWRRDSDPTAVNAYKFSGMSRVSGEAENETTISLIPNNHFGIHREGVEVNLKLTTYNLTPYEREIRESLGEE